MEEDAGVVNSCEPWCGSGIELGTSTRTNALVLEATTQPSFWIVLTASLWSQASLERGLLLPHLPKHQDCPTMPSLFLEPHKNIF